MPGHALNQRRLADGGKPAAIWRPRYCQWIPNEPSGDARCRCQQPVWPAGAAYCAAHARRAVDGGGGYGE